MVREKRDKKEAEVGGKTQEGGKILEKGGRKARGGVKRPKVDNTLDTI